MTHYTHRYSDVNDLSQYEVIANYDNGSSAVTDPHNAAGWIALGNTPAKVSGDRFILVNAGIVSVDPNMAVILAAETTEQTAKQARIAELIDAITDGTASIDTADTIPKLRRILKKVIRVLEIHLKLGESITGASNEKH